MSLRTLVMLIALGACMSAPGARGAVADTRAELEQQRRSLELQLRRERVRLLRDDPEISAIHARIRKLYRELDAALAAKPVVRNLQNRLAAVDAALEQPRQEDVAP